MERILACKERKVTGKNEMNRLRAAGYIPGNIISGGQATSVSFLEKEFSKMLAGGLRQASLFDLEVEGGAKSRVFVKEIQRHPVNGRVMHVDFYRVIPGQKTLVRVAVETSGVARGIKAGGALEHFIRVLKVKSSPENMQDVVSVDISDLDVGQSLYLEDLKLPAEWDILLRGNPIVLKIAQSRLSRTADPAEQGAAAKS